MSSPGSYPLGMQYTFEDGSVSVDGQHLATLDQEFWRDRADVVIAGEPWRFLRSGADMLAEHDGAQIMIAQQEGFWRPKWSMRMPTGSFELRRAGMWGSPFELVAGDTVIASIETTSSWSYKPQLTTEHLAAEEAVFTVWVARRIVARASSAAAAGAA